MKRRDPARRDPPRRSPGQAMAEFALVVPFFFLAFMGIIEAGRAVAFYEALNHATREGARYAIVNGSNSLDCPSGPMPLGAASCDLTGERVKDRVRKAAFGMLGNALVVPDPQWTPNNERGSTVRVSAVWTYRTLIPLLPIPPITVEAESTLVINN